MYPRRGSNRNSSEVTADTLLVLGRPTGSAAGSAAGAGDVTPGGQPVYDTPPTRMVGGGSLWGRKNEK